MQEIILFDLDNAPQVPAAIPIANELESRGYKVLLSVKNRSRAWELMALENRTFFKFEDSAYSGIIGKALSTISRAISLTRLIKENKISRAIGLGSRSLPISSWITGIPSVSIIDYEWVNTTIYNKFSTAILIPDVVTKRQCRSAGINLSKVTYFPGIRQNIYINTRPKTSKIRNYLNIDPKKTNILLRPPATKAHYHNKDTQFSYANAVSQLQSQENTELYCFSRQNNDSKTYGIKQLTKVFNGIELISSFDAIVGAGGSMTREAAVLGIPSYTCFKGPMGMVDQYLVKKGRLFETPNSFIPHYKNLPILSPDINPLQIIIDAILKF